MKERITGCSASPQLVFAGDVITNDPAAATDAAVQIVYPRAALQKVWLDASNGTVYVIYPQFWPTPIRDRDGSW